MTFRDIHFPETFQYSSDSENIPLEFYESTFPIAKEIDLLLGYFSSNAFKVLSESFAEFIFNGGSMRIITNHIFSFKDKENLLVNNKLESEDEIIDIFGDIEKLAKELSEEGKHFFDCLKFLIKQERLKILPVKFNHMELAHCKKMILYDGIDYISTDGSINFTLSALIKNSESFNVNVPWEGEIFKKRINTEKHNFDKIFNKQHSDYEYLNSNQIESVINQIGRSKEIQDLLEDSVKIDNSKFNEKVKKILELKKIRFENKITELKTIAQDPRFPFAEGPRGYQNEAYNSWIKNDFKGIFAMATGTGKTITSLNCVVEEFKKTKEYSVVITVPTITLVNQWVDEAKKFNFKSIISTAGNKKWDVELRRLLFNKEHGIGTSHNFLFITTYASFNKSKCQKLITKISNENTILIADEAHNFGASTSLRNLPYNIIKRIGLSATPERIYDEEGSVKLYEYFNSFPPVYTYKFSMREAIDKGFLTPYFYYPYFVNLEHDELEEYLELTRRLVKFFDFDSGKFKDSATQLLIKRKRIIHKAHNKKDCLRKIFQDVEAKNASLKYTFVYVPEGYESNTQTDEEHEIEEDDMRIINEYSKIINSFGYKTYQFLGETKNRDKILNQFKSGALEILTAMKALDEGVDIPITKNAIFCASTGNPRQFIQRRGRVLRTFKDKTHANIYDMIVTPSMDLMVNEEPELKDMEVRIFKSELKRVANFLYSSENLMEVINDKIRVVADSYNLDIFELINENIENYKL
jgi:superfamily II DNA or RNA helicase